MSRTWRLSAFLAAACVSALVINSAVAQSATDPVGQTEPAAASPNADDDATKPGWLLGGQKRAVNPFRATPAPGTGGALQNQPGSLPLTPRIRQPITPSAPGVVAGPTANAPGRVPGCSIGFRRLGTTCVAVEIPENATLDITGHGWMCNRGFQRQGQGCVAVVVPENASLDATGRRWACNYGFRRQQGQGCIAVMVPEHASLDQAGHNWVCNQGYERRDQGCIDDATARLQQQADKAVNARPGSGQAAQRPSVTINSGESRSGRTSGAKVIIGRF